MSPRRYSTGAWTGTCLTIRGSALPNFRKNWKSLREIFSHSGIRGNGKAFGARFSTFGRNSSSGTDVEQLYNIRMLRIAKHIKLVTTLIIPTFIVGGSGVSFVIQKCSMRPKTACCTVMDDGMVSNCACQSRPGNEVSVRSDAACMSSTLIGGLTTNPGVLETNQPVRKTPVVVAPTGDDVACPQLTNVAIPHVFMAEKAPPPSVEKHILNATLLI
jgi:hypothetical protein